MASLPALRSSPSRYTTMPQLPQTRAAIHGASTGVFAPHPGQLMASGVLKVVSR